MSINYPPLSVIIPIYNGEADLPELVACLLEQTYPSSQVEYLLVDNNSRDRTAELLQTFAQEAKTQGIALIALTEAKVQSSYAARNQGIRKASHDILVFTDADCRPQPDWLTLLVQPFTNSEVGIVAGEITALPGETLLEQYADFHDTLSQKYTLDHSFCAYGQTANLAIRRQAFAEVGMFRPHLTTGGDADICWRILRESQWKLEFVPEAIVRHRHRSTLAELRSQWQRYGRSNLYLHELHDVPLMEGLNRGGYLRRIARWLLKEVPRHSLKAIAGKAKTVDFILTPLDLFCLQARMTGQQRAKLPDLARKIDWIDPELP